MRAPMVGAFALTLLSALVALVFGVLVTAGMSSSMSAREAGDLLMWMGGGQLLAVTLFVAGFGWLAQRWSGAAPPWWSFVLLALMLLVAAAMLFFMAMIGMNR